eukprot:Em0019g554a
MTCQIAVGDFRDCTCGVQYRDMEKRCCSDLTCLKPVALSENFTCPFVCANGGSYSAETNQCLCAEGYGGLCCEKESGTCGDILLTATGKIMYPAALSDRTSMDGIGNCSWRVSTDPMRRIALGAFSFDSTAFDCQNSYVAVYDGKNNKAPLIGTFCKLRPFQTIFSSDRHIYIEYTAPKTEFELHYITFYTGQECGPISEYWRSTDIITSPHYPFNYRANEKCSWEIRVRNETDLLISILDFDLAATPTCSEGDRLVLSKKDQNGIEALKVICGQAAYRIRGVSTLVVEFFSDSNIQSRGFKLRYMQIPNWA